MHLRWLAGDPEEPGEVLWDGDNQCSRDGAQDEGCQERSFQGGENMAQAMGDGFPGC